MCLSPEATGTNRAAHLLILPRRTMKSRTREPFVRIMGNLQRPDKKDEPLGKGQRRRGCWPSPICLASCERAAA